MNNILVLSVAFAFFINISSVVALECYVCTNQEDNSAKCRKTIATCEYGQDVCLTEIKWGSTPYWDQAARKQFYVTKRCSTRSECQTIRQRNMAYCTRLWYQDWTCSDCCRGDRCNYYVINESGLQQPQNIILWTTILILISTIY